MLRLQEGRVIYNNSEDLGLVQDMIFSTGSFAIFINEELKECISEEDCSLSEQEVFNVYHEYYKATGGIKPKAGITLEQIKANKVKELDTSCTNDILAGFEYTKDGTTYLLGFDVQDQSNLTQQIAILSVSTEPIVWKVKGQLVFLQFTKDEFLQMGLVAKTHKETLMQKYFTLCSQVQACTDTAGVDAVVW